MRRALGILLVLSGTFLQAAPPDLKELPNADPQSLGLNAEKLRQMSEWVREEGLDVRAMLVARRGRLAMEWYSAGVSRDHNHNTFSVTKSVASTLAGVAINQNKVSGTEATLGELLPGTMLARKNSDQARITLAQLLTMSSGIPTSRGNQAKGSPKRDLFDRVHTSDDRIRLILGLTLERKPGETFSYSNNDPQVVAAILEHAYEKDVLGLGHQILFDRLHFQNAAWQFPDKTGSYPGGYGLRLRAIDMVKLGQLYLNHGRWQGEPVLSEQWCRDATSDQTGTGYGYYWWTEKGSQGQLPFAAKGVRGQRIYVDPQNDLVFVLTADLPPEKVQTITSALIERFIQPAVNSDSMYRESRTELTRLQEELSKAAKYRPKSRFGKPLTRLPQAPSGGEVDRKRE